MSLTIRQPFAHALLLGFLVACSGQQPAPAAQPPAPAAAQPSTPISPVEAWLDCVDCSTELKAVIALRDSAVPELRSVLLNGPSPERLARHRQHLKATYDSMKEYEARRKDRRVPWGEQDYMQRYEQKYISLNRSRAANALGAIGTPQARSSLGEALKMSLPPDLQREIERLLNPVPQIANPPVPNPDVANPDVAQPDAKNATPAKPPPPKPPANVKVRH